MPEVSNLTREAPGEKAPSRTTGFCWSCGQLTEPAARCTSCGTAREVPIGDACSAVGRIHRRRVKLYKKEKSVLLGPNGAGARMLLADGSELVLDGEEYARWRVADSSPSPSLSAFYRLIMLVDQD